MPWLRLHVVTFHVVVLSGMKRWLVTTDTFDTILCQWSKVSIVTQISVLTRIWQPKSTISLTSLDLPITICIYHHALLKYHYTYIYPHAEHINFGFHGTSRSKGHCALWNTPSENTDSNEFSGFMWNVTLGIKQKRSFLSSSKMRCLNRFFLVVISSCVLLGSVSAKFPFLYFMQYLSTCSICHYVCVCICVCVCPYYMYIGVCHICVCVHVCMCMHMCVYVCVCKFAHLLAVA